MSSKQRPHLFSLKLAHALRESCIREGYSWQRFSKDLLAGITVGIIAIPLAMALAIASGVPPQYGLYTSIIAGFLIALTGGSRYSISGPTAAFVVILYPITEHYGLGGLLVASLMSGAILVCLALLRLGRLIEYIPEAVVLGFTAGIAVVIATLQLKDVMGLHPEQSGEHFIDKILILVHNAPTLHWPSFIIAGLTLGIMLLWPKLKTPIPPHLPAVVIASVLTLLLNQTGMGIDTIGSRFSYILADGTLGQGIPPVLPQFDWPWHHLGPNGQPIEWNLDTFRDLLPSAFAIAMLGAIESLLCAVVLDGMSGKRHSANSELLGQGIGNIVTPFFGGITATAAIARSAANFKSGAVTPISAIIHALVVLLGLVLLAPWLAYVPMPGMAALLLVVAWNMSEAPKALHIVKTAPFGDILVFMTCFLLTIFLDMVIAITAGILLASMLFMRDIAAMTKVTDITESKRITHYNIPEGWSVYKINGALFFAAADRIFSELAAMQSAQKGIVLYLDGVPILDAGGLSRLQEFIQFCQNNGTQLMLADLQFQPLKTLAKANIKPIEGQVSFHPTLDEALHKLHAPLR